MKLTLASISLGVIITVINPLCWGAYTAQAQGNQSEINGIFIKPDPDNPHPYFASLSRGTEVVQTGSSEGKKQIYWHSLVPGTYNLKIEAPGYKTRTMCIRMLPRKRPAGVQTLSVDAKLSKGEGVEVFWKGRCLTSN